MAKVHNLQAFVFTLFYTLVSRGILTEALNMEEAEEGACQSLPKSINVNEINSTWMESVSEWYFPAASRYELYRIAMERLSLAPEDEKFKRLSEDELINNGCFKAHLNVFSGIGLLYGFEKDGYTRAVVRGVSKNVIDIILTGPPSRSRNEE
ncbi:unnamed protein product [Orchesella dallaii]|uniref:Uncharacterized protein n=1 Tax=Orchesella dallaii TaxID=48710 RepID=A0ABP1QGC3_9HEXA